MIDNTIFSFSERLLCTNSEISEKEHSRITPRLLSAKTAKAVARNLLIGIVSLTAAPIGALYNGTCCSVLKIKQLTNGYFGHQAEKETDKKIKQYAEAFFKDLNYFGKALLTLTAIVAIPVVIALCLHKTGTTQNFEKLFGPARSIPEMPFIDPRIAEISSDKVREANEAIQKLARDIKG